MQTTRNTARRQTRWLVEIGMTAGAEAARFGIPITCCPFGDCKGVEDEWNDDVLISSWALGYAEEMIQRDIALFRDIGIDASLEHGMMIPSPDNSRVKQSLIDSFSHAVTRCDIVADAMLQ